VRLPPARSTTVIAAVTLVVHALLSLTGGLHWAYAFAGFIPATLNGFSLPGALPAWITPVTATLLHGGIVHLGFNLAMLIFCGRMVEAVTGPWGLVVLYLAGAYAAAGAQFLANPQDMSPMIGASGAISGLFGAYALLFGRPRHFVRHPALAAAVNIVWLAAAWIAVQFLMGIAFGDMGMAIATAAHVGGFLAGLVLIKPLRSLARREQG